MLEDHVCWMGQLRLRYGISQAELAKAAGVSRQLISQIELEHERQSSGHEASHFPARISVTFRCAGGGDAQFLPLHKAPHFNPDVR